MINVRISPDNEKLHNSAYERLEGNEARKIQQGAHISCSLQVLSEW